MTSSAKRLSTNPSTLLFFQETYKGDASYLPLDSIILQLPSHDLLQLELILEGKNGDNSGSAKSKDKDKDSTKQRNNYPSPELHGQLLHSFESIKYPQQIYSTPQSYNSNPRKISKQHKSHRWICPPPNMA